MGQGPFRPRYHRARIRRAQRVQPARSRYVNETTQNQSATEKNRMKTFARFLWGGIALLVFLFLSFSSYHATDSSEVGVRTIKWFGKKGVQKHVYQPGSAYFFLPIFNEWDTFDTRLQVVEMKG